MTVEAIATATPEAINAYSMAVAPRSSRMKPATAAMIGWLCFLNMVFGFLAVGSYERGEMGDQRFVGGRHRGVAGLLRAHPFVPLDLLCRERTFPAPADIKRHEQVKVGIEVARKGQRREALLLDDDAQFLLQLSDQALFRPLAAFDLAAGKLPQPCHRLALRTLCDEHAAVGVDQGAGGNQDKFDAHGPASIYAT